MSEPPHHHQIEATLHLLLLVLVFALSTKIFALSSLLTVCFAFFTLLVLLAICGRFFKPLLRS